MDAHILAAQDAVTRHARDGDEIALDQLAADGISEWLLLEDQLRMLQASEEEIQAEAARLTDTAALFHALGGGWWKSE